MRLRFHFWEAAVALVLPRENECLVGWGAGYSCCEELRVDPASPDTAGAQLVLLPTGPRSCSSTPVPPRWPCSSRPGSSSRWVSDTGVRRYSPGCLIWWFRGRMTSLSRLCAGWSCPAPPRPCLAELLWEPLGVCAQIFV